MLHEVAVSNLGVFEHVSVMFGPGMTALTGETGAGKTMLVTAIHVLLGGRADHGLVRDGADEADISGRFHDGSREIVLRRVVPAEGRTRAYIDGRPATAGELAQLGSELIAVHGQHSHRLLNHVSEQRRALDKFGGIDLSLLEAARHRCRAIDAEIAEIGGDTKARAREIDLLSHQTSELSEAALHDVDEDEKLDALEDELANAEAHRESAALLVAELADDDGVLDRLRTARTRLDSDGPFVNEAARLDALLLEFDDIVATMRDAGESMHDDPERLAAVRDRRHLLFELRRKYGDTLDEVMEFADQAGKRLDELISSDETSQRLAADRVAVLAEISEAAAVVRSARSKPPQDLLRRWRRALDRSPWNARGSRLRSMASTDPRSNFDWRPILGRRLNPSPRSLREGNWPGRCWRCNSSSTPVQTR
ncbi:MAG: AAA family ATPase [Acidobacteria bacterium]|nr:AAA family ATPase [Acidobacteriota bacterium]